MNQTIEHLTNHISVRNFKDERLSQATKETLLTAARSASSSNFVQAFSIIEISDDTLRKQLAQITNSAAYVENTGVFYVFVADLYRHSQILEKAGKSLTGIQNMEALLVASIDTALAAENMAVAAESLDLGICFIGGIRNNIAKVAELLNLPPYTVPLFGLTIGVPANKNEAKPRMPQANQVSENQYNWDQMSDMTEYDEITRAYYVSRGSNQQDTAWTTKMSDFLGQPRRPEVADFLRKQGFSLS